MTCTLLGTGGYSNVYQIGNRAYKPFDLVSPAVKTDQMVQFDATKRVLHSKNSSLAQHVNISTVVLKGKPTEAISMPYTCGMHSLDKSDAWRNPTKAQLKMLGNWLDEILNELQRCKLVMLDFKSSNIIEDPSAGVLQLCDWDALSPEEDAIAYCDTLNPIARGTYDPFCSDHPVTYTINALRYATNFSAAITVCVLYFQQHPQLTRPMNIIEFDKRHRAVQTLLSLCLGSCPSWFVLPQDLKTELNASTFFDDL